MASGWPPSDDAALSVLLYEFKADLNAYLAGWTCPQDLARLPI